MLRPRASVNFIVSSFVAWTVLLGAGCDKAPSEVAERPPGTTTDPKPSNRSKDQSLTREHGRVPDISTDESPPYPTEENMRAQDEWMDVEAEMLRSTSAAPRHLRSTPGLSLDADDPQSHAPLQRPPSHIGNEFLDADEPLSQLSGDDVTPMHLGVDRDVDDPLQRVYDDPAPNHISTGAPSLPVP